MPRQWQIFEWHRDLIKGVLKWRWGELNRSTRRCARQERRGQNLDRVQTILTAGGTILMDAFNAVSTRDRKTAAFDVEIAAVATAVPEHVIAQAEVERRSRRFYPQFAHMAALYANTGVGTRYFCMPEDWYEAPRSWEERTAVFQKHALDLLERVASDAVSRAGLRLDQIDAVVTNTITGLAIPSLDAMLMNRMKFGQHTERLPTFGLGCGGGVAGFARATRLAQTMPGGNVLFLTIDLCSLCMRVNDPAIAMYVALALFGDGAAGVVLRNTQRAGEDGAGASARWSRWASISGPAPSTSWAGTSPMTASASCSARNCRR